MLVGIASSGVHSNGFSLVRKIVADAGLDLHEVYPELGDRPLGEVLLTPTRIYVKQVLEVIRRCDVHGISHITGGGFDENIPRILHDGQGIEIAEGSWEILPVFRFPRRSTARCRTARCSTSSTWASAWWSPSTKARRSRPSIC